MISREKIEDSLYYKSFVEASITIKPYCLKHTRIPQDVYDHYVCALVTYRRYLDNIGIKMPKQKYPYDYSNKSTWRYLTPIRDLRFGLVRTENPDWIYHDAS